MVSKKQLEQIQAQLDYLYKNLNNLREVIEDEEAEYEVDNQLKEIEINLQQIANYLGR